MTSHVETEIVPFLRGELPPRERARVAAHVDGCAECRRAVDETRAVLARLGASLPRPPALNWSRYGAEVRARVEARRRGAGRWWSQPVPLVASVGLMAALLLLSVQERTTTPELPVVEEAALGARLDFLEKYPVVERLDLLEDLDVIRQLDELPVREG